MGRRGESTDKENKTIQASTTETSNGNSGTTTVSQFKEGVFYLDVSSVSGTSPTLDVDIEAKDPVSGNFVVIDSFSQQTSQGTTRLAIQEPLGKEVRAAWTIGGTSPSFTFSVSSTLET